MGDLAGQSARSWLSFGQYAYSLCIELPKTPAERRKIQLIRRECRPDQEELRIGSRLARTLLTENAASPERVSGQPGEEKR